MLGLSKCSEEDFSYFKGANLRYITNVSTIITSCTLTILLFLAIEYFIGRSCESEFCSVLMKLGIVLSLISISISVISKTGTGIYKIQKFVVIYEVICNFIFSIALYGVSVIMIYADNIQTTGIKLVTGTLILGIIYIIYILINLIKGIRAGKTRNEDCSEIVHGKLFYKIAYLSFSVPIIVIFTRMARRITITLNNNGGSSIVLLIICLLSAFVLQIMISSIIPEGLILIYCKFRFKSFNIQYAEEALKPFVNRNKGFKQKRKKKKRN